MRSSVTKASRVHAEFPHPCPQGVRIDLEDRGRPAGPFDAATSGSERTLDVAPHRGGQGLDGARGSGGRVA